MKKKKLACERRVLYVRASSFPSKKSVTSAPRLRRVAMVAATASPTDPAATAPAAQSKPSGATRPFSCRLEATAAAEAAATTAADLRTIDFTRPAMEVR